MWTSPLSDSYRIQTCNLLIRSQMLYSVELRSRLASALFASAKLLHFYFTCKFFAKILVIFLTIRIGRSFVFLELHSACRLEPPV